MRPTRLELEGFGSFREYTCIEFDGVDLFALVGPTGSGKSTVLDAITFALYGSVPRYDDARLVAPVIAQGKLQGRVRLDFTIGERAYTAVRVVRRQARGATTREARLESADDVLAGSAPEMNSAVEELIGLRFDHFTKCVVLPQGDFAQFLHAKSSERQDLLVRLLDVGIYRQLAVLAGQRRDTAEREAAGTEALLSGAFANATAEALADAEARRTAIEALQAEFDADEPRLGALQEQARAREREGAVARGHTDALSSLRPPDDLKTIATNLAAARTRVVDTEEAVRLANAAVEAAERALSELPPKVDLAVLLDKHRRRAEAAVTVGEAERARVGAAEQEAAARAAFDAAQAKLSAETVTLEAVARADSAYHAAQGLQVGDRCPICSQVLQQAPSLVPPDGLEEAESAVKRASRDRDTASAGVANAQSQAAARAAEHEACVRNLADLDADLHGELNEDAAKAALAAVRAAEQALEATRTQNREALKAADAARADAARCDAAERKAWLALHTARVTVGALAPPEPDPTNLPGSWNALLAWARARREEQEAAAAEAERERVRVEAEHEAIVDRQRTRCLELQLELGMSTPRDTCVGALANVRSECTRLRADIEEAGRLRESLASSKREAAVAGALAQHLRADRFERWYLAKALRRLITGASTVLRGLTGAQYSLALTEDASDFVVVDHANADETRSVKTLSGGETFLASLSLALALADDVVALSSQRTARLDALFLDEGFGTLDPATLDTVTSAIEELSSTRMVGVVTHVRELAEHMPVRFEVRKDPSGSRIERVAG